MPNPLRATRAPACQTGAARLGQPWALALCALALTSSPASAQTPKGPRLTPPLNAVDWARQIDRLSAPAATRPMATAREVAPATMPNAATAQPGAGMGSGVLTSVSTAPAIRGTSFEEVVRQRTGMVPPPPPVAIAPPATTLPPAPPVATARSTASPAQAAPATPAAQAASAPGTAIANPYSHKDLTGWRATFLRLMEGFGKR